MRSRISRRPLGIFRGRSRESLKGASLVYAKFNSVEERFWAKVDKNGPTVHSSIGPCWIWTAHLDEHGYGQFMLRTRKIARAPRFAWALTNGEIPDGLHVLHHCDNPACVRPEHLFLGSRRDNARDMMSKGRQNFQRSPNLRPRGNRHGLVKDPSRAARGEHHGSRTRPEKQPKGSGHGMSVLTENAVSEIRHLAGQTTHADLARRFGVSKGTIGFIIRRETWRHVK